MKTLTILLIAALTLSAEGLNIEKKFEVQKLTPGEVSAIAKADAELETATAALMKAQQAVESAQKARGAIIQRVTKGVAPFEDGCAWPSVPSNGGTYVITTRGYRRVEIRGAYLLISSGTEACENFSRVLLGMSN